MSEKQINVLVPELVRRKIDEIINQRNAELLKLGYEAIPRNHYYYAGIKKFVVDELGWSESMEWAKKKIMIEKLVKDIQKVIEEAHNV